MLKANQFPQIAVWIFVFVMGSCKTWGQQAQSAWSPEKTKQLNELLETMHDQKQFNGSVLLAEKGKIVFEQQLGFANINEQSPLTVNSSFRLASVSKQFTAMGIMLLKEQGKLDYDDDIRKYLPSLPYQDVTIRHLLHHTAGLPDYERWFRSNWDSDTPMANRKTAYNKDVVEQFSKHHPKIDFAPGERWDYSNTGYVLLGHIIEQASEQPVREFLQENIFTPLKMEHTQAFTPSDDFTVPEQVFGFRYLADGINHVDNDWDFLNGMIGDGGIYASARDLLKWDRALATNQLVKAETLNEAFTSGKTNDQKETGYGFGWMIKEEDKNVTEVNHSGGWVGFVTFIVRDIKNDRTLIILTNHSSAHFGAILNGIAKIKVGDESDAPKASASQQLAQLINTQGIEATVTEYQRIKNSESDQYTFSERDLIELAELYRDKEQFDVAAEVYQIAFDVNEKSSRAIAGRGICLVELGKQNLQAAIQLNPGNQDAIKMLTQLGEPPTATPELTSDQLDEYVGEFPLADTFVIQISREGTSLLGQATGQPKFSMKSIAKDRFSITEIDDAQISFQRDSDGKIKSLTLHQNGLEQKANRKHSEQ